MKIDEVLDRLQLYLTPPVASVFGIRGFSLRFYAFADSFTVTFNNEEVLYIQPKN